MKLAGKSQEPLPLPGKPGNRIKQISCYRIFQDQIAVAADFISPSRLLRRPPDNPVQHALPVYKQPQIRAFIIITHKITIKAHGSTPRRRIRHQIIRNLMIFRIFMCLSDSHDQISFHTPKFRIRLLLHLLYRIMALNRYPGHPRKFFLQLPPQLIIQTLRFIINGIK